MNNRYEYYNEKYSVHHRRCIDGKYTGGNRCKGYCEFYQHPGFLTAELMAAHRCQEKGCPYLQQKPIRRWRIDTRQNIVARLNSF